MTYTDLGLNDQLRAVNSPAGNDRETVTALNFESNYQIPTQSIRSSQLTVGAVGTAQLADLSVTTAKLADAAVVLAKLGTASVDTDNIIGSAITTLKIAGSAITTTKIALNAITSDTLAGSAVTTTKIADAAITNLKVGTAAILNANLGTACVLTANIGTGAITNALIGTAAILTANIGTGVITSALIANAAVGSAAIGTAVIQNVHMGTASILNAQLGTAIINDANIGTLTANSISSGTIAANIALVGTIGFNQLYGGTAILGGTTSGNGVLNVNNNSGSAVVTLDNTGITVNNGSIVLYNSNGTMSYDKSGVISASNFFTAGAVSGGNQVISGTANTGLTGGTLSFVLTRPSYVLYLSDFYYYLTEPPPVGSNSCNGKVDMNIGTSQIESVFLNAGADFGMSSSMHEVRLEDAGTINFNLSARLTTIYAGTPSMFISNWQMSRIILGT